MTTADKITRQARPMTTADKTTRQARPMRLRACGWVLALLALTPVVIPTSGQAQSRASAYGCRVSCWARAFIEGFLHITDRWTDTTDRGVVIKTSTTEDLTWTLSSRRTVLLTSPNGVPAFSASLEGDVSSYRDEADVSIIPGCSTETKLSAMLGKMPLTGAVGVVGVSGTPQADVYVRMAFDSSRQTIKPNLTFQDSGRTCDDGTIVASSHSISPGYPSLGNVPDSLHKKAPFTLDPQHVHTISVGFRTPIHSSVHRPGGPGLLKQDYVRRGVVYTLVDLTLCPDQSLNKNCHLDGKPDLQP